MDDIVGSPKPDRANPSCGECRRRKAKCDRTQPCSTCRRFRRACLYERVARTPLTRQYVSEVEKELAATKALLLRYEHESDSYRHNLSINGAGEAGQRNEQSIGQSNATTSGPGSGVAVNARSPDVRPARASSYVNGSNSINYQGNTFENATGTLAHEHRPDPSRHTESGQSLIMETPPSSGDFDWDERGIRPNDGKFADGMASLTEASSRGYMGVASGAALLRLAADNEETEVTNNVDSNQDDRLSYLPLTPAMHFGASQLEPYVDAYFAVYHVSYPIVHEATFRAQFMEVIPRPKGHAWQVLLHIIAAIGCFTSSETLAEADEALFEAAKARLSIDMLETGNITLVQVLTLISNYVQKRNKPNSGYNYLGLAKRMAMGIGLHKEFPSWRSKPLMLEIRRRVWWCLYIFDIGAVITFSRPLDLPSDGIEVELPLNVHDGDITASTQACPAETQATTLYTHVRCQSEFHLVTSGIYARLISSPYPSAEEMLKLDERHLASYQDNLPPWFREGVEQPFKFKLCHAILQWRIYNFRILMFRAFLMRKLMLRPDPSANTHHSLDHHESLAVQRCLETSAHTIHQITQYWRQSRHNVITCWYALYFLFQACLIPVICLRNEPQSPQASGWRDQIMNAMEILADMTRLNSAASRCHIAITRLCGSYLAPDMNQWNSPIDESPQTQLNGLYSFMWPMTDAQNALGYDLAMYETATQGFMNQLSGL